jgi:5-methylcytosine-specific restriction endonuclease McrA
VGAFLQEEYDMTEESLRSQQRKDEWASGRRKGGWHHTKKAKINISKNTKKALENPELRKTRSRKGSKNPFFVDGRSLVKGYKSFLNGRRRILKLKAEGNHTFGEWENLKAQYNWTCPACGKSEPEIKLTEDHIIPLSKGGSDNIENIQPLCKSCNSRKNTEVIKYE